MVMMPLSHLSPGVHQQGGLLRQSNTLAVTSSEHDIVIWRIPKLWGYSGRSQTIQVTRPGLRTETTILRNP